eukprot:7300628-Heterocapsa_arctica.AAC.1
MQPRGKASRCRAGHRCRDDQHDEEAHEQARPSGLRPQRQARRTESSAAGYPPETARPCADERPR